MSHSPFATLLPPPADGGPGAKFLADAARARRAVEALAPDAIVVIGPDHFHGNCYDVMPPFVLGVEHAAGFGDFGSTEGPLPVAGPLAGSVHNGLTDAGFDISLSYSLTVDHGIVQTYEMLTGGTTLPMVPLVVNTAAPPLPSLRRCVALGAALRSAAFPGRVLVAASGGLSHWLPSNDPREVAGERRDSLIHGRATSTPSRRPANPASARWPATPAPASTRSGTTGSSSACPRVTPSRWRHWVTRSWKTWRAAAATRSAAG